MCRPVVLTGPGLIHVAQELADNDAQLLLLSLLHLLHHDLQVPMLLSILQGQ